MEPITLEHQSIIAPIWKQLCHRYNLQFSEYSFANVYLFRKKYDYQFIDCNTPCVQGHFKNGRHFIIPAVSPQDISLQISQCSLYKPYCFFPIPDMWTEDFKRMGLLLTSCRADADYLFSVTKLQTLAGRELSSRRNLLNQLEREHHLESKELDDVEVEKALELLEKWQTQSGKSPESTDYFSCKEALELRSRLGLCGRVAYVDGKPFGFTIGELLTPTTAILRFAKFLREIKGATPFLYKDFASHLPTEVLWINLEQDLGIPQLRQAKKAYDPDMLLTKWKTCY